MPPPITMLIWLSVHPEISRFSFVRRRLFNKIDIQPTYMHKYSSSLSPVPHSQIHMLIQIISHTYVTLVPQGTSPPEERTNNPSESPRSLSLDIVTLCPTLSSVLTGSSASVDLGTRPFVFGISSPERRLDDSWVIRRTYCPSHFQPTTARSFRDLATRP